MKTYEIKEVSVNMPDGTKVKKQTIVYYDNDGDSGTPEFYKEGETFIRSGYERR